MTTSTIPMTPYSAHKIVNAALKEAGLSVIPPQMMYQYVNKGYIPCVLVEDKKRVTQEAVATWLEGYIAKKTKTPETTKVTPSPWNFGDLVDEVATETLEEVTETADEDEA
jgi:hypothetical protein